MPLWWETWTSYLEFLFFSFFTEFSICFSGLKDSSESTWNQSTRWRVIPKLSVLNPEWADWRFSKQAKKDLRGLRSPLGRRDKEDVSGKESLNSIGRNGMRVLPYSTLKSAGFCKLSNHRYWFMILSMQRRCPQRPKTLGNFPLGRTGKTLSVQIFSLPI